MKTEKENWRNNCSSCPYFDQCRSNKTAEECKSFLNRVMTNNLLKFAKDCKYYAISDKCEVLETFSSTEQADKYIKDHPDIFQIIYRKETSVNGEVYYGPFRVYYNGK